MAIQKITPFLWFEKNNAEEAMNFYISVFQDSRIVEIVRYPTDMQLGPVPNMGGKVLTGIFELEGQQFMCLDGGPLWSITGAISFLVECEDQTELDHYWNALSADTDAEQCGWCKDKYGVSWQIVPKGMSAMMTNPDRAKVKRVMDAMLEMKKLDIAALQKAENGE